MNFRKFFMWCLLVCLIMAPFLFLYFQLYHYFTFEYLETYHTILFKWIAEHYFLSILIYMFIYISVVALSIPSALFLTIAGGYLFGPFAILYIAISATMGATIIFTIVRLTLYDVFRKKVDHVLFKMDKEFRAHAFYYLLFLRLVYLFPFWLVNIAAGLANVRLRIFISATFFGILPATCIYVLIGNAFRRAVISHETFNYEILLKGEFLFPLFGLAILALIPIFFKSKK